MKSLRVGIVGVGAIGSRLAEFLAREFPEKVRVDFVSDLEKKRIVAIKKKWVPYAKEMDWKSIVDRADLIIETACQDVALPIAKRALRKNKQVLILSVGGLLERDGLSTILNRTKGRLWIPSGALAGVDALLAASQGKIRQVMLTIHKPVAGFTGAPYLWKNHIQISKIKSKTLIFEGDAVEANRAFPRNANVAATLALAAGVSPRQTHIKIYTSPVYRYNRHEVEIKGDFGSIRTEVESIPSKANPRTSEIAVLSAKATLKKIFDHLHIGT